MFGDPVTNPKGWEVKPLKELVSIKGGGTPSKAKPEYWLEGTIPWVSPKDMKSDYIGSSIDYITENAILKSSTKMIVEGSVLMVVRSGVLKHSLPLAISTRPLTINQDMKALTVYSEINNHFLFFFLKACKQHLLSTVRGTTADNLSSDVINNMNVFIPPKDKQEYFSQLAIKFQKFDGDIKLTSGAISELFNSLSQKAFAGEL